MNIGCRMPKKIKRSPLDKLVKHWHRASPDARQKFLESVLAPDAQQACPVRAEQNSDALIANGRYLLPATVTRIERIMISRRIDPNEIMREMGFAGHGMALTRALVRQASLRLSVIAALRDWIISNENTVFEKETSESP
jgi:hypothetical protein